MRKLLSIRDGSGQAARKMRPLENVCPDWPGESWQMRLWDSEIDGTREGFFFGDGNRNGHGDGHGSTAIEAPH